jgi:hypothetical protein
VRTEQRLSSTPNPYFETPHRIHHQQAQRDR